MAAEKSIGASLVKTQGTPITIAGITNLGEVGVESTEIDTTSLDSTGGYRETIGSLKDGGEMSLEGFIKDEDNFEAMLALAESQSIESWEITFNSGAKWFLRGWVKMWKKGSDEVETARTFTGSIRIVGQPVYSQSGVSA